MKDKSEMLNGDGGYGYEGREDENRTKERRLTPFERLSNDLSNDQKCLKEITLGKRIGFIEFEENSEVGISRKSKWVSMH